MSIFKLPSDRQLALALLLLRATVGVFFILHGVQKVFMMGLPAVEQGFVQSGIPFAAIAAPAISWLEIIAGALLIPGLLTRPFAFLLACDMVGAIVFVHAKSGFFLPTGYEFALLMGVLSIVLVIDGAGAFSIDGLIGRRRAVA